LRERGAPETEIAEWEQVHRTIFEYSSGLCTRTNNIFQFIMETKPTMEPGALAKLKVLLTEDEDLQEVLGMAWIEEALRECAEIVLYEDECAEAAE
jgi:hypothetical protein